MGVFTCNIITLTICFLGLLGNFLCLLVLFQQSMRKLCYTYLLIGLSFSDIILLTLSAFRTLIALTLLDVDLNNPTVKIIVFICDWICTGGTKYYTVAISLERCWAILFPIKSRKHLTRGFGQRFSFSVFVFVVLLTGISFVYNFFGDTNSFQIYAAIILHFAPFIFVLILNVLIYLGLRRFQKKRANLNETEASEVSVTRMLFTVVMVFGFCYSFEFLRRILNYNNYFDFEKYDYYDYLVNKLADIFYVGNSSVNFLVYCLLGKTFRQQFFQLLQRATPRFKIRTSNLIKSVSNTTPSTTSNKSSTSSTQNCIIECRENPNHGQ